MIVNREVARNVEKLVGKEAAVLAAAVAERSGGAASDLDLMVGILELPKEKRKARIEELRQWVRDFDAGIIVPDEEVDNAD